MNMSIAPSTETTLIRVGSDEYARQNKSYGLTSLKNQHLALKDTMEAGLALSTTPRRKRRAQSGAWTLTD